MPPEPREFRLGGLLFLLAMAACVTGTAVSWPHEPLGSALAIGLASALAVFGAGLVVSAFAGRLGAGTVVAVIITGGLLGGAALLPDNITTSWSDTNWRPAGAATVRESYELGTGDGTLDLTAFDLAAGQTVSTSVEAGAGQIRVIVPSGAEIEVYTEIGMGAFTYESGVGAGGDGGMEDSWGGVSQWRETEYPAEPGAEPAGRIELRLDLGIGHVVVERR
jgi:hypothetical protein